MPDFKLKHDKLITIAEGRYRQEKRWKNKDILWSAIVSRLSETHRTSETAAEYKAAKKDRQDEIKDIGGFVGGHIAGGRRKKGAVTFRSLITLDIDYGNIDAWECYKLLYDSAAAIYSTHSHTEEKPRLRLIIPLADELEPDQYEPVARKIASDLDIEIFDNTTFQEERLMYWPSTPKDGEYIFEYQDGPVLKFEKVLKRYRDWQDASQWPVSIKVGGQVKRAMKKQGDPLEKGGIVGAFCRTYDIENAIDNFLNDIYEKSETEERYSYINGSTANGLIVYDSKFAYSHHGTDPISGTLCNAFDLVRVHRFKELDEDCDPRTSIVHRPSFIEMRKLAMGDAEVRKQVVTEKIDSAKEDFEEAGIFELNNDWVAQLEMDVKGSIKATIDNYVLILENDAILKDRLVYDSFCNRGYVIKPFPWQKETDKRPLIDNDISNIRHHIEKVYGVTHNGKLEDAIEVIFKRYSYHPVRKYLNSVKWDGNFRLDTLLIDYYGAEDTEYVREVTRKAIVAAVARIFEPGCKFDYMLVLKGDQGLKKSWLFNILAGDWFSDSLTVMHGKEAYEHIQGFWILEVAELSAFKRSEIEHVKNFITKRSDSYRPAYGKHTVTHKRQCILVGSVNPDDFLQDQSGNRRFWIVEVNKRADQNQIAEIRDQVWAEAVTMYKSGEELYLNEEMEKEAIDVQEQFTEQDVRINDLIEYLNKPLPENWSTMDNWQRREFINGDPLEAKGKLLRSEISARDIWVELFGGNIKDLSKQQTRDINAMMKRIKGWKFTQLRREGVRIKMFRRIFFEVTNPEKQVKRAVFTQNLD